MSQDTHKLAIATEFLEVAAVLWMDGGNYFASLHLAAAAEEISGKACRIERKGSYLDMLREAAKRALAACGIGHSEIEIRDAVYGAKNAIKHMDSRNDSKVDIDARNEAAGHIVAAYRNFESLGLAEALSGTVQAVVESDAFVVELDG